MLKKALQRIKDRDILLRLERLADRIRTPVIATWTIGRPARCWIGFEELGGNRFWGLVVSSATKNGKWEVFNAREIEEIGACRVGEERFREEDGW